MAKPSTRAKKKYNRETYDRYEFSLRKDSKLNAIIERYKLAEGANLSCLLKTLLRGHFGLSAFEADEIFPRYYFGPDGAHIPNTGLDRYFPPVPHGSGIEKSGPGGAKCI